MTIIFSLSWQPNIKNPEYNPAENIIITYEKLFLQKPGYLTLVAQLTCGKYQTEYKINTISTNKLKKIQDKQYYWCITCNRNLKTVMEQCEHDDGL